MFATQSGPCAKCGGDKAAAQRLVGFDGKYYCFPCVSQQSETLLDYMRLHDSFHEAVPDRVSRSCRSLHSILWEQIWRFSRPNRPRATMFLVLVLFVVAFGLTWTAFHLLLDLLIGPVVFVAMMTFFFMRFVYYAFSHEGTVGRSVFIQGGRVHFCHEGTISRSSTLDKCRLMELDYPMLFGAKAQEQETLFGMGVFVLADQQWSWRMMWGGEPNRSCLCGWTAETQSVLKSFMVLAGLEKNLQLLKKSKVETVIEPRSGDSM